MSKVLAQSGALEMGGGAMFLWDMGNASDTNTCQQGRCFATRIPDAKRYISRNHHSCVSTITSLSLGYRVRMGRTAIPQLLTLPFDVIANCNSIFLRQHIYKGEKREFFTSPLDVAGNENRRDTILKLAHSRRNGGS